MLAAHTPSPGVRAVNLPVARRALALFACLHGVAHLAGTGAVLSRAGDGRSVDYLAGAWTVSDPVALRAFGVVWALLAVAFAVAALVTWQGRAWWPRALWWAAVASLALVVVALWSSVFGVAVDLALLGIAWRAGGLPGRGARP